ncbi:FYVE, RhoGEF and PH domain-containing protein 6 [Trichomycterus rosablanca]|uniref:FYVE, RhoGEF and PH domain-containing protein 6 n=1 Tax=Trichomycterus rosablanca TaxID=2290929 RepID=UPI002F354F12
MSTGMKKPPLAPKPRLLGSQKPAPPPIAPKPEILQPSPSPSPLKRSKPALAPKPCLAKVIPQTLQTHPTVSISKTEGVPASKNGGLSQYIIPPKDHKVGNGKTRGSEETSETTRDGDGPADELSCNSIQDNVSPNREGVQLDAPTDSPNTTPDVHEETTAVGERDHTDTQKSWNVQSEKTAEHSDEIRADVSVPSAPSKPLPVPQPRRPRRNVLLRQKGVESPPETPTGTHRHTVTSTSSTSDSLPDSLPEKTECDTNLTHSRDHTHSLANHISSIDTDPTQCTDPIHNARISRDVTPPEIDDFSEPPSNSEPRVSMGSVEEEVEEEELKPPAPPPRQKSLPQKGSFAYKTSSSLDNLLSEYAEPHCHDDKLSNEEEDDEDDGGDDEDDDDDDAYGDFTRCPFTRSLPKQIKLNRTPRLVAATKMSSADDCSPRVAPKKPQRHSLPASTPIRKQNTPQAQAPPPVFGALPAPPNEKPSPWRITLSGIPLFGKQHLTRSVNHSKPRPALVKQRARSFSSADLLRSDSETGVHKRRSLKKLLEVRTCVKLLPKILRGGSSLDCTTTADTGCDKHPDTLPVHDEVTPAAEEGENERDCGVEYENVRLYEEIPEYMNLPWVYSNKNADSQVYEVQDPYEMQRPYSGGDLSEEDGGLSSNEEDDNSSTCSKEELDQSPDKEEVEKAKKNKVVHIAMEIMSSEKVFVDVLKLLHIDFRDSVAKASRASGKPVVEERVLNQILYYLPQLYELNKDLLRELEERVAHWSEHQRLADIFVQKGPYLKMYSTYIREFDRNVALLDEQCRKNPAFSAVVRQFETSPRCASLALKHYLLKPVQRIPQYQLLLTDYLKNLPEDSSDYKDTQTALGVVKEVANHANDIMKQGDNFQKLMQVQCSLNGHHEIVQPGRVFLKEGTLMKLSRKVMQPRMFFLFNDILLYTTPVQSGQYKVNSMLSLAGMKVSKPSQEAYQNELNIESVERSFILSAGSATERDEWLEAIATAIDDYTRKKISFISSRSQESEDVPVDGPPLGSKAPIWIPDLRTTMCMICTCEFTLTWRRHHCRACGKVVCQACSSNKYYLEYLKNQLARVCDQCYVKLQQKDKGEQSEVAVSPSGKSSAFSFSRKQKKIPAALKEVSANTENSSMSGYLHRSKGYKKPWKRLWFVIKNKVLYTYAASEDVAALESQPLLGFFLREEKSGPAEKLQFKLYHKNILYYIFRADDIPTAQRWIEAFQEAMIL